MNDKRLLELAALAAGAHMNGKCGNDPLYATEKEVAPGDFEYTQWNAMEDDGDAYRLAVDLGIVTECSEGKAFAGLGRINVTCQYDAGTTKYEASRTAICFVAAKIGESLEAKDGD